MSDLFRGPSGDITTGHPTTRNLAPAPDGPPPEPTGPLSASYPESSDQPTDAIAYGPDIPTEATFRLLGNLTDKRVLQLGSGSGAEAITMARQGARVIVVDPSLHRIETARGNVERAEVKVELHQSDVAELPFVRADSIDVALSVFALANVDDLDRVFRQVHRVLHPECAFVFSLPHPAYAMLDPDTASDDGATVIRSYFDRSVRPWFTDTDQGEERIRTIGELHTSLSRANFRVDTILEPEPAGGNRSPFWTDAMPWAPATLVIRARKEGI